MWWFCENLDKIWWFCEKKLRVVPILRELEKLLIVLFGPLFSGVFHGFSCETLCVPRTRNIFFDEKIVSFDENLDFGDGRSRRWMSFKNLNFIIFSWPFCFGFGRPKFVQIWWIWCRWKADDEIYPNLAKRN